jgi:hypothetical protein
MNSHIQRHVQPYTSTSKVQSCSGTERYKNNNNNIDINNKARSTTQSFAVKPKTVTLQPTSTTQNVQENERAALFHGKLRSFAVSPYEVFEVGKHSPFAAS